MATEVLTSAYLSKQFGLKLNDKWSFHKRMFVHTLYHEVEWHSTGDVLTSACLPKQSILKLDDSWGFDKRMFVRTICLKLMKIEVLTSVRLSKQYVLKCNENWGFGKGMYSAICSEARWHLRFWQTYVCPHPLSWSSVTVGALTMACIVR